MNDPKIIIVCGQGKTKAAEAIRQTLAINFKTQKIVNEISKLSSGKSEEIFIVEADLKNKKQSGELLKLVKKNHHVVLVVVNNGQALDLGNFSENKEGIKEIVKFAKALPLDGFLVLNYDDKLVREIEGRNTLKTFTFGLQNGANFMASDVHINSGTNLKVNYSGNSIPIRQERVSGQEYVYSALAASCVGVAMGLNLVQVSEALK